MKLNKMKKADIKKKVDNVSKMAFGFCAGAGIVAVSYMFKMNKLNAMCEDMKADRDLFSEGCDFYRSKVDELQHEVDIRDCMVMEGIDGDADIFARRMQHFRDYKIQTTDIGQDLEDSEDLCKESALDAEVTYHIYLNSIKSCDNKIPIINEDDELPF